jgi:hypothetical protein
MLDNMSNCFELSTTSIANIFPIGQMHQSMLIYYCFSVKYFIANIAFKRCNCNIRLLRHFSCFADISQLFSSYSFVNLFHFFLFPNYLKNSRIWTSYDTTLNANTFQPMYTMLMRRNRNERKDGTP